MSWMDTYGGATIILLAGGWLATTAVVFFSGIGSRVIRRLKQSFLYKRGGYVNTVMILNNGVANELFIKKDPDGSFKHGQGKYVADRKKTILLDGIPTQINIENIAEPVDVAGYDTSDKMSTAELVQVIDNNNSDDIIGVLLHFKPYALIIAGVLVIAVAASLYFGYQSYDLLQTVVTNTGSSLGGGGR
jgi:hypothetical protein